MKPSCGGDDAIRGVGVKLAGQPNAVYRDGRLDRRKLKPGQRQSTVDPSPDIVAQR